MILRRSRPIYNCTELYLYEIMEDYKSASTEDVRDEIFRSFCTLIWSNDNKRKVYTKQIHFHVRKDLLTTELGKVFDTWSSIEYQSYRPTTREEDWKSIIRQKINNIYTRYFDKSVILNPEYMDLLKAPKRLYYECKGGMELTPEEATLRIDTAIADSLTIKQRLQSEKMDLSWINYKRVMETFLRTAFQNCKLIENYEDKNSVSSRLDFFTEDHFYVKYINSCLEGEIRKWQKMYYGVNRNKPFKRCTSCSRLFNYSSHNQVRCPDCQAVHNRKNKTHWQQKYRVEKQKTLESVLF